MTAYDFSFVKNTSIAFDPTVDTINFGALIASGFTVEQDGDDLTLTYSNGDFVTLEGTTLAQLSVTHTANPATGGNPNTIFTGSTSAIYVGDNTNGTAVDAIGNTMTTAGQLYLNGSNLIYGLAGDDGITADGAGNQIIFGGSGGDNISANGAGNNTIYGGNGVGDSTDGNDNITLGGGGNTVYANAGNDSITAGATAGGTTSTYYMGVGNDTIASAAPHAGNFVVYGNSGNDILNLNAASTGDVTLFGGNGIADSTDGNDTITLGTGALTVYGNAGNDTIGFGATAAGKAVMIAAGVGNDSVTSGAGNLTSTATIYGNTGNDTLDLGAHLGNSTIFGGNGISDSTDGDDVITVSRNKSTVYGNAGNDTINIANLAATTGEANVYTGLGTDVVNIANNNAASSKINLFLADGAETVNFTAADGNLVSINGFNGTSDVLNWALSNAANATDLVVSGNFIFNDAAGGTDGDRQYQAAGEEAVSFVGYTGEFNATNVKFVGAPTQVLATNLNSGVAATLTGGAGNSQLVSGSTADTMILGTGNTVTRIDAGGGNDIIQMTGDQLTTTVTIAGGDGIDTILLTADTTGALGGTDFANKSSVEILKYGNFNFGNLVDTLVGGAGAGTAQSAGIHTVDATAVAGGNTVNITATDYTNAVNLTFLGGSGAHTFVGGAGNDTFTGGEGAANITGGAGNDSITGGSGADVLIGGADNDTIVGGGGNDTITGGTGVDSLTGGAGNDTFIFAATSSGTNAGSDALLVASLDRITDFVVVDDTLQFADLGTETFVLQATSQAVVNALNGGTGAATLLEALNAVHNALGDGSTHAVGTAFQFGGNTYATVTYDVAGNYTANTDVVVRLDGLLSLTTADFTYA